MKTSTFLSQSLRHWFSRSLRRQHSGSPVSTAAYDIVRQSAGAASPAGSTPSRSRANSGSASVVLSPAMYPVGAPMPVQPALELPEPAACGRLRHYVSLSSYDGLALAKYDMERQHVQFGLLHPLQVSFSEWQQTRLAPMQRTYSCLRNVVIRLANEGVGGTLMGAEAGIYRHYDQTAVTCSVGQQVNELLIAGRYVIDVVPTQHDALVAIERLCANYLGKLSSTEGRQQQELGALQQRVAALRFAATLPSVGAEQGGSHDDEHGHANRYLK